MLASLEHTRRPSNAKQPALQATNCHVTRCARAILPTFPPFNESLEFQVGDCLGALVVRGTELGFEGVINSSAAMTVLDL
jgi:hypothetical protein